MNYIKVSFACNPNHDFVVDILSAELAEIGFESFVNKTSGVDAYVAENMFSKSQIDDLLHNFVLEAQIKYTTESIADKNWNEAWEKHFFKPIIIDNQCIVHSSFHQVEGDFPYRIIIDPKMAFGTGHHQTTHLMLKEILAMEMDGKTVLDMGCGTAVLGILASMRGAKSVMCIDIEEWAYHNALENIAINNITNATVQHGDAALLGTHKFDIIFANINRNILLQDIPQYRAVLNKGGQLIMSGFYKEDLPAIRDKCEAYEMHFETFREMDNWVAARFSL